MATDSKVEPAMTAEEWARYLAFPSEVNEAELAHILDHATWAETRHALAALCLHGQPFGFTREDVALLRRATDFVESDWGTRPFEGLRSLADRIEALLPPEE